MTRIFQMHANNRKSWIGQAGDIVAVVGLKDTLTGDTLCDTQHPCSAGEHHVSRRR